MTDKKLTDSEIIKALEEWIKNYDGSYVNFKKLGNALDLINRLQAENSNLTSDLTSLQNDLTSAKAENERLRENNKAIMQTIADVHTEAYKECIEKVKEEIKQALKSNYKAIQGRIAYYENQGDMFVGDEFVDYCNGKVDCLRGLDDFLDNLLKELVGEDNA